MLLPLAQTALISSIAGIISGCSFVYQQKSIFCVSKKSLLFFLFFGRFALLCLYGWFLLRLPIHTSILGIGIYIVTFWLIVIKFKVIHHERS